MRKVYSVEISNRLFFKDRNVASKFYMEHDNAILWDSVTVSEDIYNAIEFDDDNEILPLYQEEKI